MSTLLSAQSVGYDNAFGVLLSEISFSLKKGDRIGLIGDNGCGKSTLLQILSGALPAHTGTVTLSHQCLMARIEQHLPPELHACSLLDAVLAQLPAGQHLSERWRCEALLAELGFESESWTLTAGTLSGGQHTRLLLARALIRQPDLLLLDEPSNHLDLPTLLWLEQFLRSWNGSFVLVSHDRYLLDQVTNCTWILRDKTLQFFRLPCSAARTALAEQDAADEQRRHAEQKEIDRVEKSAKRLAVWGKVYDNEDLARKAKQMEKRVDRLKEEQTTLTAGSPWRLRLQGEALDADRLLALPHWAVRPAPDAPVLFNLEHLRVKSGDRIAIVGRNGCGKSSLLRLLWREYQQQTQRPALFHPRVRIGYYDQSLQQLRDEDTLSEALAQFAPLTEEQRKMALIGAGFPYLRHHQQIRSLSGGERSRLLFVGLTLANHSLLLLDEPTNHLDMAGKEELAETLRQFPGAVMLVTHDRMLIEQSCNRFWLIDQQKLEEWHDLAPVYQRLAGETPALPTAGKADADTPTPDERLKGEEALLTALFALESKLEADLARKPKHQKPELQARWRREIADITARLNLG
ncbi:MULTISPECIES: ABC-F family ATP-binding cassette domain-containing protein [Serratia]|jgi:ATP-binding cassette, subfamily F, member 3|uniref:ABC-F family ATP-binding cassette domain-containing protein n=1 Tax=Serratia TaxID=613 RepID=UPI0024C48BB0|nr:ABC-F family ATP-binding cassette domain-containing protein [Serratia marcescens]MDK1708662.1 ABC-F family ATP-binding cassette domain-containing protein [Serratia marcescens]MDP8670222.1 ABC-F family ATP-binding cassette domain-containing protein [Serratia marcescens]MDP8694883.1 ABC-F family ATP-binding cassette domain-containing protein [Serratia marcescens]MDP8724546.1 ABC-F family ATP-binding cassette domain-containing protein [Serratia marcescens]MDV2099427.1 ABC-F family ATP-binding 